jgi:hypothetical protein
MQRPIPLRKRLHVSCALPRDCHWRNPAGPRVLLLDHLSASLGAPKNDGARTVSAAARTQHHQVDLPVSRHWPAIADGMQSEPPEGVHGEQTGTPRQPSADRERRSCRQIAQCGHGGVRLEWTKDRFGATAMRRIEPRRLHSISPNDVERPLKGAPQIRTYAQRSSLPVELEEPSPTSDQIDPGLAPGMSVSPRNR